MDQKNRPLISIIVPVSNAGIRLNKCLETLLNQTLRDIEIICILDTPTDGSDKTVFSYSRSDTRISVIVNESNLHIAESRNRGIKKASGEYIGFSDHDDWRELDMYERLYHLAKSEDADIVTSNSFLERDNSTEIHKYGDATREGVISSLILPMWSSVNPNLLGKSVWSAIYKRELIEIHSIFFPDKRIYYEEDTLFNLQAFIQAKTITHIDKAFYHWIKHSDSTSDKPVDDINLRQVNYFGFISQTLKNNSLVKAYKKQFSILVSSFVFADIKVFNRLQVEWLIRLSEFSGCLKKKCIDNYSGQVFSVQNMFQFYLLKIRLTGLKMRHIFSAGSKIYSGHDKSICNNSVL
jgi:glycosyltransferase involved in cell wall biosynthesis